MKNIALIGIDLGENSSIFIRRDRRGKADYRKELYPATVNRIFGDMPRPQPSQWKPVAVPLLYGTQLDELAAFPKADITTICPPVR